MQTPSVLPWIFLGLACHGAPSPRSRPGRATQAEHEPAPLHHESEVHLGRIRQLTFGGENAEGYFNSAGDRIVFQARKGSTGYDCDQIFEMDLASRATRLVSTGRGKTTCAYYLAGDRRILYSSTHLSGPDCPPEPSRARGYVWSIHPAYDIFSVGTDGSSDLVRMTDTPGYDAEATYCVAIDRLVFTSVRDGDLELYSMRPDGSDIRRLTHRLGYDGGAFFSRDGRKIVWRAHYPSTAEAKKEFLDLLGRGLVRPSKMEIWIAEADGGKPRQLTENGRANFAPYFFPSGNRVIFASNMTGSPRMFHLYAIDTETREIERITYSSRFNSFPMFSPDGKYLVFASNRNNSRPGETNLFLAEWRD
ncbi:MAG: hypothetical protein ACE5F1_04790 [Planctomycetota bacterium]